MLWFVGVVWCGLVLAAGSGTLAEAQQQAVPEVVKPGTNAPTLPPGTSDGTAPRPRSENPLADGGATRPVPDSGVVAPPNPGVGSPMVIPPPATGTMPVIPPPGSPGGDRTVVPK